jgi:hypothetical protein
MEAHAYVRNVREVHIETDKLGVVAVAGLIVHLQLISKRSDSLMAVRHVRKPEKAIEIVDKLKAAGLRLNIVKSGPYYMAYIATADPLGLAEKDEAIKKVIALYLAKKVKNGTPRQREIAEKILKRDPLFS